MDMTKMKAAAAMLCLSMALTSCTPHQPPTDTKKTTVSPEQTIETTVDNENKQGVSDVVVPDVSAPVDVELVPDDTALEDILQSLDAVIATDPASHPNRVYVEMFLNALVAGDTGELTKWFGQDMMGESAGILDEIDRTVIDAYEIYPVILPDLYQYDEEFVLEDYLVKLSVSRADGRSSAFAVGDVYKLLRAPGEYSFAEFCDPMLPVLDALQKTELDKDIRVITEAMEYGLHLPDGETTSAELRIADFLHQGFHTYSDIYDVTRSFSLNEINAYLGARIAGFTPFDSAGLLQEINPIFDIPGETLPEHFTDDTWLYGCSLGHGGLAYAYSYSGTSFTKNDAEVRFLLYADAARFITAAEVRFIFDITGDVPVFLSVSRKTTDGLEPFSYIL